MEKPQLIVRKGNEKSPLGESYNSAVVHDSISVQIEELFLIRNPKFKFDPNYQSELAEFEKTLLGGGDKAQYGNWFFFPWNRTIAHFLPEGEWYELRTARNKDLITRDEQQKFYGTTIGIAGLSVGSHVALTIAMMGGARRMVLADPDVVGPSNLNRVRADALDIDVNKAVLAARSIYQLNPYAELTVLPDGVNENDMRQFFDTAPLDLLIEETDKLSLKIGLREEARKRKIPVIMGTDNGDGIILDVERYDLHPDLQLFNGVIGDITLETFRNFPPHELPKLATRIAGAELAQPRMKDSILRVGKTLYSWPQLGDAATLCGVTLAYIARRIANDMPTREGKYAVNLEQIIDPTYNSEGATQERDEHHLAFMNTIGLSSSNNI